jgi:Transposase DDE domain
MFLQRKSPGTMGTNPRAINLLHIGRKALNENEFASPIVIRVERTLPEETTMERELWPRIYHLVMACGTSIRQSDVTFQPHLLVLVLLWAALHDRPQSWACDEANWSTTALRPAALPSAATVSRRLRSIAVGVLMRDLAARLRDIVPPPLIAALDGKPLPLGGASHDPDARNGHGAGKIARGYKLHAVWGGRPMPEAWSVEPLNVCETKAAEALLPELVGRGGGYLLADGEYDANGVFDAAGAVGYQLVAPREDPGAGLGHRRQSPYRLRCIELLRGTVGAAGSLRDRIDRTFGAFGRELYALRGRIERSFGNATSFAGGLGPLPAWVRRMHRVWRWVWAKLLINAVRIVMKQGLTANMQ